MSEEKALHLQSQSMAARCSKPKANTKLADSRRTTHSPPTRQYSTFHAYVTSTLTIPRYFKHNNRRISFTFFGLLPFPRTGSTHEVFFLAQLAAHRVRDHRLDAMHSARHRRSFQVRQRCVRASRRGRRLTIPLQLISCTVLISTGKDNSGNGFLVDRGCYAIGVGRTCVARRPVPSTRNVECTRPTRGWFLSRSLQM